jgi:hypothetical protein
MKRGTQNVRLNLIIHTNINGTLHEDKIHHHGYLLATAHHKTIVCNTDIRISSEEDIAPNLTGSDIYAKSILTCQAKLIIKLFSFIHEWHL